MSKKHLPKVLVAPLDWGLGHSTRCIPIIKYLLEYNCTVIIGAEGKVSTLLKAEFPQVQLLHLKGYRVQYSDSKRLLPIKILCQLPKIIRRIHKEHQWLKRIIKLHNIDAVISDNRFGLYNNKIPCVFITHQLFIKGPNKWIERMMQRINYKHINNFSACWVPDFEGMPDLAGGLSHPAFKPSVPVVYLGALSRLNLIKQSTKKYDALIILSGPEPQRSIFEQLVLKSAVSCSGRYLLVRGLPGATQVPPAPENMEVRNHLPANELNMAFQQSEWIISRAGYTTIMDIVKLQKKAVIIPTPGQTEQEYVAMHLQQQHICLAIDQQNFNLQQALLQAASFDYSLPVYPMDLYEKTLAAWLERLQHRSL